MQKLIRIISASATLLLVAVLIFFYYQNKKYPTLNPSTQPYQVFNIGDKDDYYQLTIPREFGANMPKDSNTIYMSNVASPEMRVWGDELRKANIDEGLKKGSKIEISTITITRHTGESARLNDNKFMMQNIKEDNFLTKPTDEFSKKLVKKYPSIKVYVNKKTKEVGYYAFDDKNDLLVIAAFNSDIQGHPIPRIYASYKGKFEIYFWLPKLFFYNMPEVTNSIIDLVSTFEPTHYKNHSSSLALEASQQQNQ